GVRVDAQAEHDAAGPVFFHVDVDVGKIASVDVLDLDVRRNALLVCFENAEPSEVGLGFANVGIGQDLTGIERHLADDDVLPRGRVADDANLADVLGRLLLGNLVDGASHASLTLRV